MLANTATLSKNLAGTSEKLDAAFTDLANLAKAIDAKKLGSVVENVQQFSQTLADNRGNVDGALKDVSEIAAKLDKSADKLDGLMTSVQGFVGSPDTKSALSEVGDAAKSVRQFADDLNVRTKELSVGLTRFSGAIHSTTHNHQAERHLDVHRGLFNFTRNLKQIHFQAPASWAGNHHRPAATQLERFQHLVSHSNFFHGIGGQRYADRVADAFRQKHAHPHAGFDGAGKLRPRLGNAEVEGIITLPGHQPVGRNSEFYV